ncbi:MAG: DUF3303 domain-containing protein [Armatimonadetes bacterium]|nr:DUF3303 domain-containing protein [Armatimonadota bacterium]
MLFMVTERFHDTVAIRKRFLEKGRMMPDDVKFVDSFISLDGSLCFQLMTAPDESALQPWTENWSDLMEFEITAVLPSADFWQKFEKI